MQIVENQTILILISSLEYFERQHKMVEVQLCFQTLATQTNGMIFLQYIMFLQDEDAFSGPYTCVLLVCIYNKCSNIITHDMLYEIFAPYGQVMRILIFVKAKVWKAFIEMDSLDTAKYAAQKLNNVAVFSDGSKMIIYPSKLEQINFQNGNNGGVDYQELRHFNDFTNKSMSDLESYHSEQISNYYNWSDAAKSQPNLGKQTFSTGQTQNNTNVSLGELNNKYQDDEWFSPFRNRKRQSTWNNHWYDVDRQFEQIALESEQYRSLVSRPKSKTIIPFNLKQQEQIADNSTSKVLFLRSIMPYHTTKSIYNILTNFGNVCKIVHMIQKQSMLAEFEHIEDAIQAKDFLNLVKNGIKIFFSHYDSLVDREAGQSQQIHEYYISAPKKQFFNPPSETLHISYLSQYNQQQFLKLVSQYGSLTQMKWQKHQNNNKSMLLIKMSNMQQSMKVMGFLQGRKIGSKYLKISFTRSKLGSEERLA